MIDQHARQESNDPAILAGKPHVARSGGAQSGARSDGSASPVRSLLLRLTAGQTPDERAALARMLGKSEDGTVG